MNEADFQVRFGRWIVADDCPIQGSGAYELKLVKGDGNNLAFSKVEIHQPEALRRASGRSDVAAALYHKPSDLTPGLKPCDCLVVRGGVGMLVVQYWRPGVRHFYMVDVGEWLAFVAAKGGRGSMSEEEAGEIGVRYEF